MIALSRKFVVFLVFTIVAIAGSVPVAAQDDTSPRRCNDRSVQGSWAYLLTGTRVAPGSDPPVVEAVVGTSLVTFDGKGGVTLISTEHGATSGLRRTTLTGTYSVDSNCEGVLTATIPNVPVPLVEHFIVADDRNELRYAILSPAPVMINGTARRVWSAPR